MKRVFVYVAALFMLAPEPLDASTRQVQSCLVLGDSIAQGLAPYRPQCNVVAKEGANSATIARMAPSHPYGVVYVSAGSNDPINPKLGVNLFAIRRKYSHSSVVWIAPRNSRAAERVYETAVYHHDRIVYLAKFKSNDGIHPKDYKAVAKKL